MNNKKQYQKPAIQIERFVMDIEIATDDFNMAEIYLGMYRDAHNGSNPSSEEELRAWLSANGLGDNNSSHSCYFTSVNPS